jgi:signal peptidase I
MVRHQLSAGHPGMAWLALGLRCGVTAVAGTLVGLGFWSVAPTAVGLRADVVMSGSMNPQLRPGDIVVSQGGQTAPRPGQVIIFRDPGDPGRTIVHRVITSRSDGTMTTRGDANPVADPIPVPASAVLGTARLRVPWIGLPAYWMHQQRFIPLLAAIVLVLLGVHTWTRTGERTAELGPFTYRGRSSSSNGRW